MLKEEKELREYVIGTAPLVDENGRIRIEVSRLITSFREAVREDCAKVAESVHVDEYGNGQICDAAAAIRRKK